MNRKAQIVAVIMPTAMCIAVAFCIAVHPPRDRSPQNRREVVDMTSHSVLIPFDPRRVLSLCTSATDTMVRLGAVERLAAMDEYSRIVPGTEGIDVIGKGSAISREQVIALEIDLAFIWWYQHDAATLLDELSVPVVRIRNGRMNEVPEMIRFLGTCLNCSQAAESLARDIEQHIVRTASKPVASTTRVYLELYSPLRTVGGDSYINDLLTLAGGKNIAGDTSGSVQLSVERLIEADPDVILFVEGFATIPSIGGRSGMSELTAVQNGHIYSIDRYWLVAGAGLPAAEKNLRKVLTNNPNPIRER